jgi:putative PIN family toxin of toxin-antitoxin system
MPKAVLDTTVLVSAFLIPRRGGASFELLRFAMEGAYDLVLSSDILDETARVLLTRQHLRRRYDYPDEAIVTYCQSLARLATAVLNHPPPVQVVRDPEDDKILACALAAEADYLVTRDDDLLCLKSYHHVRMIEPEAFLAVLRAAQS